MKPLAIADEKDNAQIVFKLADARRDIGLNAIEASRRARHAAFMDNRVEYPQIRQIHVSLHEMDKIIIIHFI